MLSLTEVPFNGSKFPKDTWGQPPVGGQPRLSPMGTLFPSSTSNMLHLCSVVLQVTGEAPTDGNKTCKAG